MNISNRMQILSFLLGVSFLSFLSCSTYYTKLYLIGDPPNDFLRWDGEEIISDFQNWKFNLEAIGSIKNPNKKDVNLDSIGISIYALPGNPNLLGEDKIIIDRPIVILGTDTTQVELISFSNYTAQGAVCFIFRDIHIPAIEQYITVRFKIILTKPSGTEYDKECEYTLHRYETREKGIPKGLFH